VFLKPKPKKVMLVDDEQDFIMPVKFFLEAKGFSVIEAHNGKEALEKVKEIPDIILLDIKLPDIDGFEVFRKIRSNSDFIGIPVIILTCSTDTKSIFDSQDLRATDYLMKTAELDEILVVVKKCLKFSDAKK
jgi:DNA-binding response OmpR family regulator